MWRHHDNGVVDEAVDVRTAPDGLSHGGISNRAGQRLLAAVAAYEQGLCGSPDGADLVE